MNQAQEQAALTRSYYLWQESGSAHGRDQEHWRQAEQEIEAAELARMQRVEDGRRRVSIAPATPLAMFFALTQGWIDFGFTMAGFGIWPAWQPRAG